MGKNAHCVSVKAWVQVPGHGKSRAFLYQPSSIVRLSGCWSNSRFCERLCLKGIRWRMKEQDTGFHSWPLCRHLHMYTSYTETQVHTRRKQKKEGRDGGTEGGGVEGHRERRRREEQSMII